MIVNLFRLLLVFFAAVLLRRLWRGLTAPARRTPRRGDEAGSKQPEGKSPISQQPIEEADYEELP